MKYDAPAVVYFFAGLFALLIFLSLYRRRELITAKIRQLILAFGAFALVFVLAFQFTHDGVKAMLAGFLAEVILLVRAAPRRTRYIPRSERRKAIARYELSGKKYDPKRHHIDHIVPYARGGGSKADNLRVLDREKNLAKSAKPPWWDVLGR